MGGDKVWKIIFSRLRFLGTNQQLLKKFNSMIEEIAHLR